MYTVKKLISSVFNYPKLCFDISKWDTLEIARSSAARYTLFIFIYIFFVLENSNAAAIKLGLSHDLHNVVKSKLSHYEKDDNEVRQFPKPMDKFFIRERKGYGITLLYEFKKNKDIYISWERKNIPFHMLQLDANNTEVYLIPPFNHSGNLYKPAQEVKCNYAHLVDAGEMLVTGEQIRGVRKSNHEAKLSASVANLKMDTLMIGGKVTLEKKIFFTRPFLKFGLGVSLNKISAKKYNGYIQENRDEAVRKNQERKIASPKINLNSDTKNKLGYTIDSEQKKYANMSLELGLGFDIKLNEKVNLDIAAVYYNYGKNTIAQGTIFKNKGVVLKSGISLKI